MVIPNERRRLDYDSKPNCRCGLYHGEGDLVMVERKRLTAAEQKDFINLCAVESLLQLKALMPRLNGETHKRAYDAVMDLVTGTMEQMPLEQLQSYQKQMRHIAISIGVKNAGNFDDWDGRYLRFSEINALLDGCGDHCLMCDKLPQTMKRCGIRKVYNTIPAESVCSGLSCEE